MIAIARAAVLALPLLAAFACGVESTGAEAGRAGETGVMPAGRAAAPHLPIGRAPVPSMLGPGNLGALPEDHDGFFPPRDGRHVEPQIPAYTADGRIIEIIRDWYPFRTQDRARVNRFRDRGADRLNGSAAAARAFVR